jgi:low affinity Fe/Cu permease
VSLSEFFNHCARKSALALGSPLAFLCALVIVLVWIITGPFFDYSDTWQLVINTGTTVITFLMVFLIQNTQNRDAKAIHLKLDELIHTAKGARNSMIDLENCTDEELERLQHQFERLRMTASAVSEQAEAIAARRPGSAQHSTMKPSRPGLPESLGKPDKTRQDTGE